MTHLNYKLKAVASETRERAAYIILVCTVIHIESMELLSNYR